MDETERVEVFSGSSKARKIFDFGCPIFDWAPPRRFADGAAAPPIENRVPRYFEWLFLQQRRKGAKKDRKGELW
jgi:hypothetical protein